MTYDSLTELLPTGRAPNGTLVFPEGVRPYYIRTSERTNFKKCRRLWNYTSQNRRNLEPVRMNNALSFGINIHKALEKYYHPDNWHLPTEVRRDLALVEFASVLEAQRVSESEARSGLDDDRLEEYAEQKELGLGMLHRYAEWAEKRDEGITPLAVEMKYQIILLDEKGVPLIVNNRPVVYQIRADLVLRDEYDKLWILDHKTAGSFGDLGFLDLDTQLSTYPWVLQGVLGEHVEGVIYNELLKSVPEPPKVLKKGNLSVDKRQNTTYELFIQAIQEKGFDTAPYDDMLEHLRNNPRDYFRRTPSPRTPEQLKAQGQHVLDEVRDMLLGPDGTGPKLYPNPGKFNCNYCDFRAPCGIENELGDVEFLLTDPYAFRQRTSEDPNEDEL